MLDTTSITPQLKLAARTVTGAAPIWRGILLLLFVAIGFLALTPQPPTSIDTGWDKLNHALAFAALAFAGGLGKPFSALNRGVLLLALLAYGGCIELLQLYVPGRVGEWSDLFADAIGIMCGAALAHYAHRAANTP